MSDRERDDAGQFQETVTLDAVLEVFDEVRGPVITSSDVAETLDCSTEAARQKLRQLYDRGDVDRRKTGRPTVWWFTGGERITSDERVSEDHAETARSVRERRREEGGDRSDPSTDAPDTRPTPDAGGGQELDRALEALDTTDERREAVRGCIAYLREHGTGQKSGFVDAVYPEHPAGFGSSGGWWNKIGKEYLRTVAEDVDVIAPPPTEGSHTWRYVGGES